MMPPAPTGLVIDEEQNIFEADIAFNKPIPLPKAAKAPSIPPKSRKSVPSVFTRPLTKSSDVEKAKASSIAPEQSTRSSSKKEVDSTPAHQSYGGSSRTPSETQTGVAINPIATTRSIGGTEDIIATKLDKKDNSSEAQTHQQGPLDNKGSKKIKPKKGRGTRSAPEPEPLQDDIISSVSPGQNEVIESSTYAIDASSILPIPARIDSPPNWTSRASPNPTVIIIPTADTSLASLPKESEIEVENVDESDMSQTKSKRKGKKAQVNQRKQERAIGPVPPVHEQVLETIIPFIITDNPSGNQTGITSQSRLPYQKPDEPTSSARNRTEKAMEAGPGLITDDPTVQSSSSQKSKEMLEEDLRERIRKNEQAMEAAIRTRIYERELHEEKLKSFHLEREIQKSRDELEYFRAQKHATEQEQLKTTAHAIDKSQSELRQKLGEISNLVALGRMSLAEDPSRIQRSQDLDGIEDLQLESIKDMIQQIAAQNNERHRQGLEASKAWQARPG
jgi:hypothetical protein